MQQQLLSFQIKFHFRTNFISLRGFMKELICLNSKKAFYLP